MRLKYLLLSLTLLPSLLQARELQMPVLPDTLRVPELRASYLALHYWDNMDWGDAEAVADTPFMEQNLSSFFAILGIASPDARKEAVRHLLSEASRNQEATAAISSLSHTYLYSIQSPFFNEENYLLFADLLLEKEGGRENLGEAELLRISDRRREILKNRCGERAADFGFVDRDGNERRLSEIPGRRLLILYDNDCGECDRLKERLARSPRLQQEIEGGALHVVAVEAYGADEEAWKEKAMAMPGVWTVGRSPGGEIEGEEIYVLLTAPTVYILDGEGQVESKNISPENLEEALGFRL